MNFSILGSDGFIGHHLSTFLEKQGHTVQRFNKEAISHSLHKINKLEHVIYCIGLTGNFRQNLDATIDAHVTALMKVMQDINFSSFTYLSSTRIYDGLPPHAAVTETDKIQVFPTADSLYNLSKLLGEAYCLSQKNKNIRVARLSNVYGANQRENTFLGSIFKELKETRKTFIHEHIDSNKDYISIEEVCISLENIATRGNHRIYNVSGGSCVSHAEIFDRLASRYNVTIDSNKTAIIRKFPTIKNNRLIDEFNIKNLDKDARIQSINAVFSAITNHGQFLK